MTRSTRLAALTAAAAALAAPSAASADTLVAGPVKHKGYDLTITAADGGAKDTLSVNAIKRSGSASQMHMWSVDGAAVSIKGRKATIKGAFGRFGRIDAKLTAGRRATGRIPAGCSGTPGSARAGRLTGTTSFALDAGFFRTFKPRSMKAQILTGGKLTCGTTNQPTSGLNFSATVTEGEGMLSFSASRTGSSVDQSFLQMDPPADGVTAMHVISTKTGTSGLTAADDLSTASIKGAAPFLTGTLDFSGEAMGAMSVGTTSGDLSAKFDSIGTKVVPAGTDAILQKR